MLSLDTDAGTLWREDDLRGLLEHQLQSPLDVDLVQHDKRAAATLTSVKSVFKKPPVTFRELFLHPHPPVKLLQWVKDFGKEQLQGKERLLPREIALFLYFTSIALARRRCGRSISKLSGEKVRNGLEWLLEQPWLNEEMRTLHRELLPSGP